MHTSCTLSHPLPTPSLQVCHFGRCWAAWVAARGGADSVDSDRYLEVAEPFAAEFLRTRGALAAGGRPKGAFQVGRCGALARVGYRMTDAVC